MLDTYRVRHRQDTYEYIELCHFLK